MTDERALSLKFGIKPSTYASYRQSYDNHVKETLGNRKIKSFRHSDILEFYSRLVKKGLSIKTVKHIHTQLASAFTLACRDQIIPTNPVEGAYDVIKNISDNRGRILRALTEEEQRIFLEFINGHPVYGRYHITDICRGVQG